MFKEAKMTDLDLHLTSLQTENDQFQFYLKQAPSSDVQLMINLDPQSASKSEAIDEEMEEDNTESK